MLSRGGSIPGRPLNTLAAMPLPDVTVAVHLAVPIEEVWDEAARLESHVEWMADAHAIEFVGDQRSGNGTRMIVETRLGPLRTKDVMDIVAWEPPHRIAVSHRGLFRGTGQFLLESHEGGTRFTWEESIRFPWFLGGPIGARIARPLLAAVWRRNLRRFRERF